MANLQNIGINRERNKVDNEPSPITIGMSKENSHVPLNESHTRRAYWFAHGGSENVSTNAATPDPKAGGDQKDQQQQKDREEKIRLFKEQQEGERIRKLRELEQQFLQAKRHREQQEEERKRRIEEARVKEVERRQQVEERKRQIWEAEQERKEAILRRNMEREARIEARRNAQRNSQCFAFGSSTPRTFDLDLAALGRNSALMSSVGRRSEERDVGPPRATSACSLDRKFDNFWFADDPQGNDCHEITRSTSNEAVPSRINNLSKQIALQHKNSDEMKACLSMGDYNNGRQPYFYDNWSSGWLVGSGVLVGEDCMSRSMYSLSSSAHRGRRRTDISPTFSRERSITPRGKDTSRSPSRPHSSMSSTSEISQVSTCSTTAVNMRHRPAPRRPRPYSVAGSIVDSSISSQTSRKEPDRQPRFNDRNVAPSKPIRAKSASRENVEAKNAGPLTAPKKPVPPPKSTELVSRAKSNPVPTKDNLRKVTKATNKSQPVDTKPSTDSKEKQNVNQSTAVADSKPKNTVVAADDVPLVENKIHSEVTSPTTDSEMMISYDDSTASAVAGSDLSSVSPSVHEYDRNIQDSNVESPVQVSSPPVKSEQDDDVQNIPGEQKNEVLDGTAESTSRESVLSKPRITSEEEARAALAEKRRLAREQAEREAELERQRLEEIKRQEEEQRRLEEQEQRRMEEEQLRLAELHRKLEEEKLAKAIQEQQQREKEEQEKRDQEAKQKTEREEQERKAREEAEKQRLELAEKLRKEEEERAERKRRVEQIMARTRGKSVQSPGQNSSSPIDPTKHLTSPSDAAAMVMSVSNGIKDIQSANHNGSAVNRMSQSWSFSEARQVPTSNNTLPDLLNSENIANHSPKSNGQLEDEFSKLVVANGNGFSNGTVSANSDASPQTNGYSSHEEMSCTTSPEENTDPDLLVDFTTSYQQKSSSEFTQIASVELPSLDNVNNDSYLINVDEVNSNLFSSGNPFTGFEESLQKKQETSVTDLLS